APGLRAHSAVESAQGNCRTNAPHRAVGRKVRGADSGSSNHRSGAGVMKVVLFCGGMGTRIREYSEAVPKPMIPIGHQPILWHVMNYYSQYGHKDFVLCLGYKANTVKDFFLNYKQQTYGDVIVEGDKVQMLGPREEDWRIAMIDTGVWRNIGSRLWAVREHVKDEEVFLANYSDGLSDVNLDAM